MPFSDQAREPALIVSRPRPHMHQRPARRGIHTCQRQKIITTRTFKPTQPGSHASPASTCIHPSLHTTDSPSGGVLQHKH
jgi:hypothetical protein